VAACGASHAAPSIQPATPTHKAELAPTLAILHATLWGATGDAVLVRGSKIIAVGKSDDLAAKCGSPCETFDARGAFLTPGFHDAHVHLYSAGQAAMQLDVARMRLPQIQDAIKKYAREHGRDWIVARGWFALGALPTHADLDAVESERPIVVIDHSGHNIWVNAATMRAAGITKSTPDPPSGKIVRDPNGEPTGVFEDAAQSLITSKEPTPARDDLDRILLAGDEIANANACTASQGSGVPLEIAREYARLDRENGLKTRTFLWAPLGAKDDLFQAWIAFERSLPKEGKVHVVAFKGFADGVFVTNTAALLAPYADDPKTSGSLYLEGDAAASLVIRANRAGFPVVIHAIGDRAVRASLDAFARAKDALHHNLVNRVEHAAMIDPADAPRFAALGVAASVQPVWIRGYPNRKSFMPANKVGPERASRIYAWGALSDPTLLFGSDLPSPTNSHPIAGIYGATARTFGDEEAYFPEQNIDFAAAMTASTSAPAEAIGMGNVLGKIAPAFEADLVLLDHDPKNAKSLTDDPIKKIWIAGRAVR